MLLPRIKEHRHFHKLISTAAVLRSCVLELRAIVLTLPVVVHDQRSCRLLVNIFGGLGLYVEVTRGAGLRRALYGRFESLGVGASADYNGVTAGVSVHLVAHFRPTVKVKEVLLLWIGGNVR